MYYCTSLKDLDILFMVGSWLTTEIFLNILVFVVFQPWIQAISKCLLGVLLLEFSTDRRQRRKTRSSGSISPMRFIESMN